MSISALILAGAMAGMPLPPDAVPAAGVAEPVAAMPAVIAAPAPPEAKPADPPVPAAAPGLEIVVTARQPSPADPAAQVNAVAFEAVQAVDRVLVEPVTDGYVAAVPRPARRMLHNVLRNLDEPIVFVNFLLQRKVGKALDTFARFTINSTVGLGGTMDIARKPPFSLPRRANSLSNTLGFYGIGPGPYLVLPFIGSTTLRDVSARMIDLSLLPTAIGGPFGDPTIALGKNTLSILDDSTAMGERLRDVRSNAADPYVASREFYLAQRQAEIDALRGKGPPVPEPGFENENLTPKPQP